MTNTSINIGPIEGDFSGNIAGGDINQTIYNNTYITYLNQLPPDPYLPQLAELVRTVWVDQYLNSALLEAIYIDLGLAQQPDAVQAQPKPFANLNMRLQRADQPLPADEPSATEMVGVYEAYQQAQGHLLILGQPGAGKTTTLAHLTEQLLTEAEQNPNYPVPVIFNLSSWAAKQQPLAEWLVEELWQQYQVSRKQGKKWIKEQRLAIMLDGLDEVAVTAREACVQAINAYREDDYMGPLVVCSRLLDYQALTERLQLKQAIVLQPLTLSQRADYFDRLSHGSTDFLARLEQDTALQELLETPLLLNIITLTYGYANAPALPQAEGDSLRHEIYTAYTERMFERLGRSQTLLYPKAQILRYLYYLALQLEKHELTQFSVGQIRGSWLLEGKVQLYYNVFVKTLYGLRMGAILGIMIWLLMGGFAGVVAMLIFMLISQLLISLLGDGVEYYEDIPFKRSYSLSNIQLKHAIFMVILMTSCGMFLGSIRLYSGENNLISWLIGGLILGLFGVGSIFKDELPAVLISSQEIDNCRKNTVSNTILNLLLLIGGTIWWFIYPNHGIRMMIEFIVMFGFIFGLSIGGGFFLTQHYLRLFILNRHNLLPFKLIPFLDHATDLIFLQRIGGSYRFIHRTVQEFFAAQWVGQDNELRD
ncbi:NACHT domain-containing protein [Anaerolineales bacterium HSG6]|nr:NACHT domain-containing protein [Anaerolineales bacterium HSG6]